MNQPQSRFFGDHPRLHYLEWNPDGRNTLILMHGNTANAWWWQPVVDAMRSPMRVIALDSRGHGDSEWVRPPAYHPDDYARDLAALAEHCVSGRPIVAGHSMGGLCALAFGALYPGSARALIVVDSALSSSEQRDRFLRRLQSLPVITYPDLATAKSRFRLMPKEGHIAPALLHTIAEKSLMPADDGRWTLKFDRESFFGSDGLETRDVVRRFRGTVRASSSSPQAGRAERS
jgi:pimeloyl-ACP methyl ester carboxylesterase